MRPGAKRLIAYAGLALGLALAAYFMVSMDWAVSVELVRTISWLSLGEAVLFICVSVFFRSLRWRILAGTASGRKQPMLGFYRAASVGYLGNIVLPAKAGEALRIAYACSPIGLSVGTAASTAVLDRLLDVIGLLLPAGLIVFLFEPGPVVSGLRWFFPALILGSVALLLALSPGRLRRLLSLPAVLLPKGLQKRYQSALDKAVEGAAALRNIRICIQLFACTFAAILVDCGIHWRLFHAFGWDFPVSAVFMLEFGFAVAGSLPSAPGYLGVYQAAAVLLLSLYGIDQNAAVLYAFAMQFTQLGTFLLLGGSAAWPLLRKKTLNASYVQ
jgi:uncharacterized protein (TIRG00374 family)